MRFEFLAITFLIPAIGVLAQSCTWNAYGPDESGILSDVAAIQTLYVVEALYYNNCTQVATAHETVIIAGATFTASPPITFTFANPETDLFLTHHYPDVTLTSLTEGEELVFTQTITGVDTSIDGSGLFTITVPFQVQEVTPTGALTTTTQTTSISTTLTTTKSTGVSPGAVGGIAAGIVGGFLLIGAGAFFLLFYRRRRAPEYPREQVYQTGEIGQEPKNPTEERYDDPLSARLSYPE